VKTFGNLLVFSPELWLLAGAVVVLALGRGQAEARPGVVLALLAVVGAFFALATQLRSTLLILDGAFVLDGYAKFFDMVFLAAAALILVMTLTSAGAGDGPGASFPAFLLLATLGALLAASAAEMVSLFLGLELLSTGIVLVAVLGRRGAGSAQAGIIYLITSLAGSAVLLYGLAVTYGLTGQTNLRAVGAALSERSPSDPALLLALVLLIAGFALMLGFVPFHWWLAESFQGAPLPALAFVSSVGIGAAFAVFGRLMQSAFAPTKVGFPIVLAVLAAATMTYASLAALSQTSIRRLLAYLTIAQVGYGLAAVAAVQRGGANALLLFVLTLAISNLGACWGLLAYSQGIESDRLADLTGMSRFAPTLALIGALSLASIAGLPPLAGFFGKVFVLQAAVQAGLGWLAVVALANLLLLAFAVIRVMRVAYLDPPTFEIDPIAMGRPVMAGLGVTAAAVVALAIFLGPLYAAASAGASTLGH
jgi:NADH-quinone oxidoreductase subunit N